MKLPFHAVEVRGDILFAARGASIHSFNLKDGSHIACSWKFPAPAPASAPAAETNKNATLRKEDHLVINVSENSTPAPSQDEQGPPTKRVKLDGDDATAEGQDKNDTLSLRGGGSGGRKHKHKKQGPQPGALSQPTERTMVIIMTLTQDGRYVLAVTSDKSIWVLEHDGQGQLKQLSRRTMPKRPCSIAISPDNKDILAADKFGDVYSLPLIQSPDWNPNNSNNASPPPSEHTTAAVAAAPPAPSVVESHFKPQANELTVHTKRNRQALIDQQISASVPNRGTPRRIEAEPFERYLLLGHVSLLTAIALGFDEQRRPYILTADRDEHIRVSRGTKEQAHVIEQFCLGHDDFVNRLCIPRSMGDLLVSAGGDHDVFVWKWKEGLLVSRTPLLKDAVKTILPGATKVAVTGLYEWPLADADGEVWTRIVIICERVPAIFIYRLSALGAMEYLSSVPLAGNALDATVINSEALLVAMDLSTEDDGQNFVSNSLVGIQCGTKGESYSVENERTRGSAAAADLGDSEADASEAEIQKLLYSAETLRKMDSEEGDAE